MSDRITCPTCGHEHRRPIAARATWTDDCACSDSGRCIAHQVNAVDAPERPDDEIMAVRHAGLLKRRTEQWQTTVEKIRAATDLESDAFQRGRESVEHWKKYALPALSAEDVEALRTLHFLLGKHSHEPFAYDGAECDRALAVLSKLLRGRDA